MTRPQTIQIFLPDGSPTSIKEIELTNRLVKLILFSRTSIEAASQREIVNYTGLYFLFGENESGKNLVYIGEGENCWKRIQQHHRKKDFWTHAIIATTKTDEYTKTDGKFLEHLCLEKAKEANRYLTDNDTGSREPSISESRRYDLLDNFETLKLLMASVGYPIFENIKQKSISSQKTYFCKGKEALAEALITDEGVYVLKGSKANIDETKTIAKSTSNMRANLLNEKILNIENNVYVFTEDYLFKSPSTAASVVLGRSANGWREWKGKDGKTIDELMRK